MFFADRRMITGYAVKDFLNNISTTFCWYPSLRRDSSSWLRNAEQTVRPSMWRHLPDDKGFDKCDSPSVCCRSLDWMTCKWSTCSRSRYRGSGQRRGLQRTNSTQIELIGIRSNLSRSWKIIKLQLFLLRDTTEAMTIGRRNYLYLFVLLAVWPDWAMYWTLGNFLKPLATINLPKISHILRQFL